MAPDLDCSSPADEVMKGQLRKMKKWNKRFFVLREGPPPKLECYDSAKKFSLKGKPKRVIDLENAWNIDKKVSAKHRFLIGIFTQDEYFAMAADTAEMQQMWVEALQKAVINHRGPSSGRHCMYKHIWQGNVDTRELENCNSNLRLNLQGPHRCCLTDKSIVFIRLNNSGGADLSRNNQSKMTVVEIGILSIRGCGHKENIFHMEAGRSSGIGTGILRMELDDGTIADHMHTTILGTMYASKDASRPRSYSSGSGSSRTNVRSRHYYNPPPSQVGMGKPPSSTNTPTLHSNSKFQLPRTRCESFPATQVYLSDEARYRTSSEGETTMKRPFPLHTIRRRQGTVSPGQRVRVLSHAKKPPLNQFLHYRTSSLPGSYTSSSNSSIEHLNANHDGSENMSNGQSSATSEGNHSSDEFSSSPMNDRQVLLHHILIANEFFPGRSVTPPPHGSTPLVYDHTRFYNGHIQEIPPPPSCPPPSTHVLPSHPSNISASSPTQHEYVNVQPDHSRSHSMDDNLSCGTASSSLSTSPHLSYLAGGSASTVVGYIYSQSPSQSSSHSQSGDCLICTPTSTSPNGCDNEEYTAMGAAPGVYPHESASQPSPQYSLMSPPTATLTSGYVPMRPQVHHSSPQDIINARRRSSSDNMLEESYSPASPYSRSPDKLQTPRFPPASCAKCIKRDSAGGFFSCTHCSVVTTRPSIPPDSCHGLKVDAKNDFSRDNNHESGRSVLVNSKAARSASDFAHAGYSDEYACMDMLNQNLNDVHVKQATSSNSNIKVSPGQFERPIITDTNEVDHQYVPMSPVNNNGLGGSGKSVVNAVLSVANSPHQYPHQITEHRLTPPISYSTNSLDRSSKHSGRRHSSKSFAMARPRLQQKLKQKSLKIQCGVDSKSFSTGDGAETPGSPGGEYVSIDYDKARRQSSSPYVVSSSFGGSPEQETSIGEENSSHSSKRNARKADSSKSSHVSNGTS